MSDMSADTAVAIDLEEQLARIRRMQVESENFMAEQRKLIAEAGKLDRDRRMSVWIVFSATGGATAAALGTTLGVLRVMGVLH